MKDWENAIKWLLSIISFLFSLAVLCKAFPRFIEIPNETGFDYIGFIIGVLSLLVTVLIGWNIYSVIDLRNIKSELEEVKSASLFDSYKTSATVFGAMSDFYQRNSDVNNVFYYNVLTLSSASKCGNTDLVNKLIDTLKQNINSSHLSFYEDTKDTMIRSLYDCAHEMPNLKCDINKIVDIVNRSGTTSPDNIGV